MNLLRALGVIGPLFLNILIPIYLIILTIFKKRLMKIKLISTNVASLFIFLLMSVIIGASTINSGMNTQSINFLIVFISSFLLIWTISSFWNFHHLTEALSNLLYFCMFFYFLSILNGAQISQVSGPFLDRNYFSGFFGLCILCFYGERLYNKKLTMRKYFDLVFFIFSVVCFLSIGSRTPVFAIFILIVFSCIVWRKPFSLFMLMISVLGLFLYVSQTDTDLGRYWSADQSVLQSNGIRIILFWVALDLFADNVFLGVGPNLFRQHSLERLNEYLGSSDMPILFNGLVAHSSYLQSLSELGVVFAICLFIQMLISIIVLYRKKMNFCLFLVIYVYLLATTMEYLTNPLLIAALFSNLYFAKRLMGKMSCDKT